jgi:hypothetical protein
MRRATSVIVLLALNNGSRIRLMSLPADVSVDFPIGQALATAGQENRDRMVGANNAPPELEEAVNKFHRLDVGHGAQDGATKPFAGSEWLPAAWERLQRLGHAHLQRDRRQLPRELNPLSPLPGAFDCTGHVVGFGALWLSLGATSWVMPG